MWLYFCFSIVFVHVISTNLVKHDPKNLNTPSKETEALFAGVIKNISRVNNVLQELINNYEHLQKIYKSQENLDTTSSDDKIDKVHQSKKRKRAMIKPEATTTQANYYSGTEMILWSGDEKNNDSENASSEDIESEKEEKDSEDLQIKPSFESEEKSQADSKEELESAQDIRDKNVTEPGFIKDVVEPKQAEIIFIDQHRTTLKEEENTQSIAQEMAENKAFKPPKTRYSKVSHGHSETNNKPGHKYKTRDKLAVLRDNSGNEAQKNKELSENISKTNPHQSNFDSKKVEKTQVFSPKNIWDGIVGSKPILLEGNNEITIEKLRKDNKDFSSRQARAESESFDTGLMLTTKNQIRYIKHNTTQHKSKDNSETDEYIVKEEFKANVLREAYGDACLKLVVRKCFKACKKAGKNVCERFKCKDNYKEKFSQLSRSGCIKEFDGKGVESTEGNLRVENSNNDTKKTKKTHHYHSTDETKQTEVKVRADNSKNNNNFADMTRDGYLRTCLPHLQANIKRSDDVTQATIPSVGNETDKRINFNILRDKYERACKKVSFDKCRNACTYAYTEVCKDFTCNSSRKKEYKKACKAKCKSAYKLKHHTVSTSNDSDDSDTDDTDSDDSESLSSSSESLDL